MKLGIDISQISYHGTGVARYVRGLTNAIVDYDNRNDWTFFFSSLRSKIDRGLEEKIIKKGHKLIQVKIPASLLSILWNDLHKINIDHVTRNLDFFITSDWVEPPAKTVKKCTVVHDLTFIRYPETVDRKIINTQKKRLHWIEKESKLIFADSQSTKNDLVNYFKIEENKIHVVYPGVEVVETNTEQINLVLKKYHLQKPFILTVGKIEPRKNIQRLIEAFTGLNNDGLDLIIVGPKGWGELDLKQSSNIRFLGYLEDNDLFALYSSCLFFAYPSIWEGFGYPVVEAMKLGVPVLTSNNSSLKEIGEDTCLLFDPFDVKDIQNKLNLMINDNELRETLSEKGKIKSQEFTWKSAYNKIINTVQSLNNYHM